MNKIFYLICTTIFIFLLSLFSYTPPQPLTLDKYCHPQLPLCIFCPLFTPISLNHAFNAHAYVFSNEKTSFVTSKPGFHFKKTQCKDYLSAITFSPTSNTSKQFEQYYKNGQIELKEEDSNTILSLFIPKILQDFGDFVIITRNFGELSPQAYLEAPYNTDRLLKYARIMGWSVLWTALMIFVDNKLGLDIFFKNKVSLPILQATAIGTSLLFSYSTQSFGYLFIGEAMYLATIYLKSHKQGNSSKPYIALWMLVCILWKKLVIIGYLYVGVKLLRQQKKEKGHQSKAIGGLIAVGLLWKCLQAAITVGFTVFLSNLWIVIMLPVCLLILLTIPRDKNGQKNDI